MEDFQDKIMMQKGAKKMTKYECSRIIGIRMGQLSMSAPVLVDIPQDKQSDLLYIAMCELKNKKLDIVIRRPLPMNEYYEINVKELEIPSFIKDIVEEAEAAE